MSISPQMLKLLNNQFNMELFSVNMYLSMSSFCKTLDLDGFAHFYRIQAQEETFHAMKQFDYIHQVDGKVTVQALDAPPEHFNDLLHVFEETIKHERKVSASINTLVKQALIENDFASHTFLQWFITEQVEEEDMMNTLVKKIRMISDNQSALYLLNEELSRRSFTPPAV